MLLAVFDAATLDLQWMPLEWSHRVAVNPVTGMGYTSSRDENGGPTGVYFVDPDPLAATFHQIAGTATEFDVAIRPALDVAASRLWVLVYRASTGPAVDAIDEPVAAPIPLDVAITADPILPGFDPVVRFSATSGFADPLPIRQIYFQVDATDGAWSYADAPGPEASATLAGLAPGSHTVHAFAADGQEVTKSAGSSTLVVGPIASLDIDVPPPPACSNGVDDDGDGAADHPADAGCGSALALREDPQCDNGLDDDGDGSVDLADAECAVASDRREGVTHPGGCGIGAELVLLLGALRALGSRSR
jgi:hypothetical protein